MAADALKSNNSSFLVIAEETLKRFQSQAKGDLEARQKAVADMVAPVRDSLNKVDAQIQQMEVARGDAYGELRAQVQSLITTQKELQSETGQSGAGLAHSQRARALGRDSVAARGRDRGHAFLLRFRRAGIGDHRNGRLRPDLVVKLPGGKHVVVDAKTPLQAFLDAFETTDEDARRACLANHARQVRDHMKTLSGKKYWEQFEATPEFVVMFLPGETFFSAALEQDSWLDRARSAEPRDSRVADHADRAAEGHQLRMESGKAGAQCAADQRPRQGTARPAAPSRRAYHLGGHGARPRRRVL
jgi:DNA recombination protein RmuC